MALIGRRRRREEQMFVEGSIPMEYLYTVGPTLEPFFFALKEKGDLYGTRCGTCDIVYFPPVGFCEVCFERVGERVGLPSHGHLESYTVAYRDRHGKPMEKPVVWGLILLDDSDTPFVHRVLAGPAEVEVGASVKAKLRAKSKRTGSMNDIEGFVLA